tara:strand:+ start:448 stop:753 length:306 start_codon:yes stop_codon:yes gene_type:complete
MYDKMSIGLLQKLIKLIEKVFVSLVKAVTGLGFQDRAEYIGTFILVYLSTGGGFVFMCVLLGINPTLVLSVISAPIWIFIVYFSNKLTKVIVKNKRKEGKL